MILSYTLSCYTDEPLPHGQYAYTQSTKPNHKLLSYERQTNPFTLERHTTQTELPIHFIPCRLDHYQSTTSTAPVILTWL